MVAADRYHRLIGKCEEKRFKKKSKLKHNHPITSIRLSDVYLGFDHCSPESALSEIGSKYHHTLTFYILKHRRNGMRHMQQRSNTPSYNYYINIFYILCVWKRLYTRLIFKNSSIVRSIVRRSSCMSR